MICNAVETGARPLLEIADLRSAYGRIEALRGVNLTVGEGEIVALVGANGAGKTTAMKVISGVQPSTAGKMEFAGVPIRRFSPAARVRLGISQVPEGRQLFGPMTVEDNIKLGAFTTSSHVLHSRLAAMYQLFPVLEDKRDVPAGALSGGQQQMVAIARGLMSAPKLLLLDEPSMGLAPLMVREIFRLLRQLRDEGTTILVVEQNAEAALEIADRAYVIELGKTVLAGSGELLLAHPDVQKAYLGM